MSTVYYQGVPIDLSDRTNWVAVVGSRNATNEELEKAYYFSKRLVQAGKIVVSGLAKGIDTAAHQGAIDAGGTTIAIVNTPSFQSIYPKENQGLAESIKENGGIIYPFITKATETKEKGLSQFSKRLIERDELVAYVVSVVVTIKGAESIISGGTKYAFNYGRLYNKKLFKLTLDNKMIENPEFEKGKIWWEKELNPKYFIEDILLNRS